MLRQWWQVAIGSGFLVGAVVLSSNGWYWLATGRYWRCVLAQGLMVVVTITALHLMFFL